jgi:hypothetical protein
VRINYGEVFNENKTYTFWPIMDLDTNTTYQIKVTTGVRDVAGNAMEHEYYSHFTTQ